MIETTLTIIVEPLVCSRYVFPILTRVLTRHSRISITQRCTRQRRNGLVYVRLLP